MQKVKKQNTKSFPGDYITISPKSDECQESASDFAKIKNLKNLRRRLPAGVSLQRIEKIAGKWVWAVRTPKCEIITPRPEYVIANLSKFEARVGGAL